MARKVARIWYYIIPAVLVAAGMFYYFMDPQTTWFMPKCMMKELTGFQCPSCGAQRALHAFLPGHVAEALSYNLFFVIAIPFLLLTAYSVMMMRRPDPSRTTVLLFNFTTSRYTLYSYIVLYLAWWVIRNVIGI